MKNLLCILLLFFYSSVFSQVDYGLVGGLNFQASGDLETAFQDVASYKETAQRKTGYFIGLYGQINFLLFYLRPEIHFSQLQSDFEDLSFASKNLEAPISFGYKLLPPLSLFVGPSFQFRLQEDLDVSFETIDSQTTVGAHLGARLDLGSLALDLRYERGLKESEITFLSDKGVSGVFDARGQKWMLGLSFSLD
ncbi:MAG: outer membrane beta-barrel protein [Flavobacteriaceae bacterium]